MNLPELSSRGNIEATRRPDRWLVSAVGATFLVRFIAVIATKAYLFQPRYTGPNLARWNWEFGFEMGRVARSIASGHGFGSPFHGWTGPTAWQPPLYPYFLAGIFKLFGVYSPASGMVALTLNCVAAAATCFFVYRIANRISGRTVAIWSAWIWALSPMLMEFAVQWAWETSFSALCLVVLLWWTIQLPEQNGVRPWLRIGFLWGIVALLNPSLLSLMPFTLAWAACKKTSAQWSVLSAQGGSPALSDPPSDHRPLSTGHQQPRRVLYFVAAFALMFAMTVPWIVRDRIVMGKWMFVRDNFWAEMSYGNDQNARGEWMKWKHPAGQGPELQQYIAEGEIDYIAGKKREVLGFIRTYPRLFARLALVHAILFWTNPVADISDDLQPATILYHHTHVIVFSALAWTGLMLLLRRRSPYGWLLAPALLAYPVLYYITSPDGRYRHPIEPVMLVLAVHAVGYARKPRVSGSRST